MSNLLEAAQTEDRLKLLTELRDVLSARIDLSHSDRDLAALARQLVQVTSEIEEIRNAQPQAVNPLDEFRGKLKVVK